ncbi:hypothetical protein [Telluria aromaticivorans]|uniref:Lipoprotein n=1 Tax=Telluria aromaticivorans TaxID=2725995 RepID=A0A7Y2NYE4_9BURK|nr:hypothetical protein [Telluria aromaticivorans]NNG21973.1 hypothetical protein [Telluria aromaticivorans]
MTPRLFLLCGAMVSASILAACGGADLPQPPAQVATAFAQGLDGWQGGYADYHQDTAPGDVVWELRALPAPLAGTAYYTGGTNRSDDLFIYSKKRFGGYAPSTKYKLSFEIEIATNQSSGCVGVGGSPGESVYLVAGAASVEPKTVLSGGEYLLNIERGNQATPGPASQVLGNMANAVADCGPQVYQSKTLASAAPLAVQSDKDGNIWIFFGIDSGFEARSSVFYKSVKVAVAPLN